MLIAEVDGRAIGILQIIDPAEEETHYWGEIERGLRAIDIWIGEECDLDQGYGTEMMRLALERCFSEASVGAVLVDPLANNSGAAASMSGSAFGRWVRAPSATTTVSSTVSTVMHGGGLSVTRRSSNEWKMTPIATAMIFEPQMTLTFLAALGRGRIAGTSFAFFGVRPARAEPPSGRTGRCRDVRLGEGMASRLTVVSRTGGDGLPVSRDQDLLVAP